MHRIRLDMAIGGKTAVIPEHKLRRVVKIHCPRRHLLRRVIARTNGPIDIMPAKGWGAGIGADPGAGDVERCAVFPYASSLMPALITALSPIPSFQFGDSVIGARQPVWIDLNTPAGRVRHRNLAIGHGKGITAEQMFGPGVVIRALNGEL